MESLVLQKKKYLHTNSTSMPFYPMESILSRAWRHQQINKGHKELKALQQQGIISRIYPW